MKVVDKYELATMPKGTIFYKVSEPHGYISDGPWVLDHFTSKDYYGSPYFNGVFHLDFSFLEKDGVTVDFPDFEKGFERGIDEWRVNDTDSNDFDDNDLFAILSIEEAEYLVGILQDYVNLSKKFAKWRSRR